MKSLNKKNILSIIALVSLVSAALLYAYIYSSFSGLKSEVQKLYEESAKSKATFDEIAKVKENLKSTLGTEDRLTNLFVNKDLVVDFIQIIENVMETAEVSGAVESVTENDADNIKKLHLVLAAEGSFNEIMKFQGLLEKLPYKTTIDSVTMLNSEGATAGGWRVTVNLTAFMRPEAESATKTEVQTPTPEDEEL